MSRSRQRTQKYSNGAERATSSCKSRSWRPMRWSQLVCRSGGWWCRMWIKGSSMWTRNCRNWYSSCWSLRERRPRNGRKISSRWSGRWRVSSRQPRWSPLRQLTRLRRSGSRRYSSTRICCRARGKGFEWWSIQLVFGFVVVAMLVSRIPKREIYRISEFLFYFCLLSPTIHATDNIQSWKHYNPHMLFTLDEIEAPKPKERTVTPLLFRSTSTKTHRPSPTSSWKSASRRRSTNSQNWQNF